MDRLIRFRQSIASIRAKWRSTSPLIDTPFKETIDGFRAAQAVKEAARAHNRTLSGALIEQLMIAASYPLHLRGGGRPGCELGPTVGQSDGAWPPAIASTGDDVVELWRAIAGQATAPTAVARFEDLLFCRRDGNGFARATRAAEAYLVAAESRNLDMDAIEALLRAWTLARAIHNVDLDAKVRQKLAEVADELLTDQSAERPGVVLPVLGALASGPVGRGRSAVSDNLPVDSLLERAAAAFSRGYLATEVADYRRSRSHSADLEAIAREEVAAYFREANASIAPAFRLHHLEAAATVPNSSRTFRPRA